MAADGHLNFDTRIDESGFNKGIKKLSGMGSSACNALGAALAPLTASVSAVGIAAGKTALDFTKLYESTMVVFEKMLGGKDAANDLYDSLLSIAKASTFSQEAFLESGKKLVGMGVSAEDTTKYMQALTDAVAGFGGTSENLKNVATNFAKISTAGKLSMEDVNMLSDNGVQALKILGNQYGKTTDELRKLISDGEIPAKEAMDKLAEGIENGTDGINGMTAAMKGMSLAMKGKTLTGALDSLNSGFRNFALNLVGINPTLKETDEGFAESQKRIRQLTAVISTIANQLPRVADLFAGFSDAIGKVLDKLVGANVAFDEASGKWENVGGILGMLQEKMDSMDAENLTKIGNAILGLAGASPILLAVGKGLGPIGDVLGSLSGVSGQALATIGKMPSAFQKLSKSIVTLGGQFGTLGKTLLIPFLDLLKKLSPITGKIAKLWAALSQNILGHIGILYINISAKFRKIGGVFEKLGTAIMGKLSPIISKLSSFASYLGQWGSKVGQAFAPILKGAAAFAPQFLKFMNIAGVLGIVVAGLGLLYNAFGAQIDSILLMMQAKGPEVITNFCNGIAQALPNLIAQGATLLNNLMLTITANLPAIINGGMSIVSALISGIAAQLPVLIPTALEMILTLVTSLLGNIGQLVDAGLNLLIGLVEGILNAIPKLIEAAPTIIGNLVSAIVSNLPKIIQTGIELIGKLVIGLIQAIPDLVRSIPQIIGAIINTFAETDWGEVGKNIIKGVADGISGAVGALIDALGEVVDDALGWVKKKLGIHSPSTVFRDQIGKMMAAGMGIGFEKNVPTKEMAAGIRQAVDSVKKSAVITASVQSDDTVEKIKGKLLYQNDFGGMSSVKKSSDNSAAGSNMKKIRIEIPLSLDGREIARATANYMGEQLDWEAM